MTSPLPTDAEKLVAELRKINGAYDLARGIHYVISQATALIEKIERERDEALDLAQRSTRRLTESSEPGFIGAFARRDAALAERDQYKARVTALEAEKAKAVADEREACAKLAYDLPIAQPEYGTFTAEYCDGHSDGSDAAQAAIAAAIRARAPLSSMKESANG